MDKKVQRIKLNWGIPGIRLIVKKEIKGFRISLAALRKFYSLIKGYRRLEEKARIVQEEEETLKSKLVRLVVSHPGIAGLETTINNLRTSIYESHFREIVYDRELLKKSLGPAYEGVVLEDLRLTVTLTPDYPKEELIHFLKKFFIQEQIYKKLVKEEMILRVDETQLNKMIEEKQIQLLEGARNIQESVNWKIKTRLVKK
jgi:hypothetical protein